MWAILAAFVGLSYFTTTIASTNCEHSISATYRQQYFESLLFQKISYFDREDNATGQLTARVSSPLSAGSVLMGS
jgi:ABC-type multidrug transport system fused ATPase/permease subunit